MHIMATSHAPIIPSPFPDVPSAQLRLGPRRPEVETTNVENEQCYNSHEVSTISYIPDPSYTIGACM